MVSIIATLGSAVKGVRRYEEFVKVTKIKMYIKFLTENQVWVNFVVNLPVD